MSVSSHTEYWAGPFLSHSWNTGQNWPTHTLLYKFTLTLFTLHIVFYSFFTYPRVKKESGWWLLREEREIIKKKIRKIDILM